MEYGKSQSRADVYSGDGPNEETNKQTEERSELEPDSTLSVSSSKGIFDNTHAAPECPRQRHSQIEKRRRKKMNTYIMELSDLLPKYTTGPKSDKITILKKAVEHVKSIQGSTNLYCKLNKPPFLSDDEMKYLIHQFTKRMHDESFLFAITCVQGQFMYASETASYFLGIEQSDLLRLSIFDVLHHKDVSQVKDQLSYMLHGPLYESKKKLPQIECGISSGSWRSFFCRLKCPSSSLTVQNTQVERKHTDASNFGFLTVHCSGFIKPLEMTSESEDSVKMSDNKQNHLIVLARIIKSLKMGSELETPHSYHTKLETDGKIMQVDEKICGLLGYLPQELLGMSVYELYHQDDLSAMAKAHKCVLQTSKHVVTPEHRLRTKTGNYITLQNEMWSFINPWNKVTDCILCLSKVITLEEHDDNDFPQDGSTGPLIGVGNIGRLIAKALEKENSVSNELIPPLVTEHETNILKNNTEYYSPNDSSECSPTHSNASISSTGQSGASHSSNSPSPRNNTQHNAWPKFQLKQNDLPAARLGNNIHGRKFPPSLRNGLRNQYNETLWTGNTLEELSDQKSTYQHHHASQKSLSSNYGYQSSDDNVMSIVMSLLEDDPASFGQIDFGDLAWAL